MLERRTLAPSMTWPARANGVSRASGASLTRSTRPGGTVTDRVSEEIIPNGPNWSASAKRGTTDGIGPPSHQAQRSFLM
jgi:hypothetical protein